MCARLDAADLVYLPGGDPMRLIETLRDSMAWRTITARHAAGAWIAGSSAGAMVLGASFGGRAHGWQSGLAVLPQVAILPHAEGRALEDLIQMRAGLDANVALLALDAQTGCLCRADGAWDVVGPGGAVVLSAERRQRVFSGGVLSL